MRHEPNCLYGIIGDIECTCPEPWRDGHYQEPRLVTRQSRADEAPSAWVAQYGVEARDHDKRAIGRALRDADILTPETVAAIIGNDSWCRITCTHCDLDVAEAVVMHASHATLCKNCLADAVSALVQP
jgi:hypothetical protein